MPRYYRKVIKITAEDSPNVQLARAEMRAGLEPSNEIILPGILPWDKYEKRLATWDKMRKTIGLFGEFYEGAEVLLYPPDWLFLAKQRARTLSASKKPRKAVAIGIDPGEGEADTSMSVVDELGLLEQIDHRTEDTAVITREALAFMRAWRVEPESVIFDIGGGGRQHADRLREQGYNVRTVAFGGSPTPEAQPGKTSHEEKQEAKEDRYTYKDKRAEMYGELSYLLDPSEDTVGFAIPEEYTELLRQLALVPKTYDQHGKLFILPKTKRTPNSNERTLKEIMGRSPDQLDSLVLAVYGMQHRPKQRIIGTIKLTK